LSVRGEKTLAEASREHDVGPTNIREWIRRYESSAAAGGPNGRISARFDNGPQYTSMASVAGGADLRDAAWVLLQLREWIEDYNTRAPHSALGMRSPAGYRTERDDPLGAIVERHPRNGFCKCGRSRSEHRCRVRG